MERKPKYSIGDKVWVLEFGRAVETHITGIRMTKGGSFFYSVEESTDRFDSPVISTPESQVFLTKVALVQSL